MRRATPAASTAMSASSLAFGISLMAVSATSTAWPRGSTDPLLLFALGERDALGRTAQPLEHPLQYAGHRVAPRAQAFAVGVHVGDRLARDAGVHGGLCHRHRHIGDQPWIERHRNDV